jgi:hypothetical protein
MLHEDVKSSNVTNGEHEGNNHQVSTEDRVEHLSRAVAPILLPMIESLGTLNLDEDE